MKQLLSSCSLKSTTVVILTLQKLTVTTNLRCVAFFFSPVMLGVKRLIAHHWLGPSALVWTALNCKFNNIPVWFKPGYCTLTRKTHFRYNYLQNHSMPVVQVMHSSLVFTFQETLSSPFTC